MQPSWNYSVIHQGLKLRREEPETDEKRVIKYTEPWLPVQFPVWERSVSGNRNRAATAAGNRNGTAIKNQIYGTGTGEICNR